MGRRHATDAVADAVEFKVADDAVVVVADAVAVADVADAVAVAADAVVVAAVAAAVGCFLMAFMTNYPIALAPGMGTNAYFAFVVYHH